MAKRTPKAAKGKQKPNKARDMAADPQFQRTLENSSEFGRAATANKLIRNAFGEFVGYASDQGVSGRLTKRVARVIQTDLIHRRGERVVTWAPLRLLEGFNFNNATPLSHVMFAPYEVKVNHSTGKVLIDFPFFNPHTMTVGTKTPYDFNLMAGVASFDFADQKILLQNQSVSHFSSTDRQTSPLQVSLSIPVAFHDPLIVVLGIEIISSKGPDENTLRQKKLSALSIVRVFT